MECDYQDKETRMWTASKGEHVIDFKEFIQEVEVFYNRFWIKMWKKVDIVHKSPLRTNIMIDLDHLRKEHIERKKRFDQVMGLLKYDLFQPAEDWNVVKKALHSIMKQ